MLRPPARRIMLRTSVTLLMMLGGMPSVAAQSGATPTEGQTVTTYHVVLKGFSLPSREDARRLNDASLQQQPRCAQALRARGQPVGPVTAEQDPTPRPDVLEIYATPDRVVRVLQREALLITEHCGLGWVKTRTMSIETAAGVCVVDLVKRRASGACPGRGPTRTTVPRPPTGRPTASRTVAGQACEVYPITLLRTEVCIAREGAAGRMFPSSQNGGHRPGVLLEVRNTTTGDAMTADTASASASRCSQSSFLSPDRRCGFERA